jgi:endo-1,4-beta-xylanase
MNRRRFLKVTGISTATLAYPWAYGAEQRKAAPSDAEALSQCQERIERHRKSDARLVVRGGDGKAVPNAKVKLEQTRHDFLFGCNIYRWGRIREAALEEAYRERFAALLNFATLGFYWASYEPERGKPNYEYTDQVLEWCRQKQITPKGHPLVWDYSDPKWLPKEFAEIRELSNTRVREIVARYAGRMDIWDVVNEPTHLGRFNTRTGEWAMSMGAVPYVTESLKIARAANPKATLLVNDYRVDAPFYQILEQLRADGKLLFDTIGIQSHMHGGVWTLAKTWEVCDRYAKFGVPVHFTETTIVSGRKTNDKWGESTAEDEAKQAEYVPNLYTALFAHPAVEAITWWDFSDNGAWMSAPAGWLRKDMTPKPVYERMMSLLKKEWWSRAEGETDGQGEYTMRGFCGEYRATVTLPGGGVTTHAVALKPGRANRIELKVA